MSSNRWRILASPAGSDHRSNPYIGQLYGELRTSADVEELTWRGLLEPADVIHVHWPEYLIDSSSLLRTMTGMAKALPLLWLARRRGAVLVWTGHNLAPHETTHPRLYRLFQRGFFAQVDHIINLADSAGPLLVERYPELAGIPMSTVRHGDYRAVQPRARERRQCRADFGLPQGAQVILLAGQQREYKNAEALIHAVRHAPDLHLIVAGAPQPASFARVITDASSGDSRITVILRHLTAAELSDLHQASDVVVLPYRQDSALNSGAAHLALSLDRPAVISGSAVAEELQELAGPEWIYLHDGSIDDAIRLARQAIRAPRPRRAPLDSIAWPRLAEQTLTAYGQAIASRRNRRRLRRNRS